MKKDTKLVHSGRHPEEHFGAVNTPVYHVSTVLYPTVEDMNNFTSARISYGRHGSPVTQSFQEAMCDIESADYCLITSSGLHAITTALLAFLRPGDHLLMVDTTYSPTRSFCDGLLTQMGIETSYYDPLIGSDITTLMRPNTRAVFTESPGSLSFEVQDLPAISKAAKSFAPAQKEVLVMIDNTWATPLFFKPLEHGADISIQAVTKYIGGHADVMLGTVACKEHHKKNLDFARWQLGLSAAPDDVYLATRGLRSLAARLRHHQNNALEIAAWLQSRPEVDQVIYPALPGDPGHEIWARDFTGATGLFGFSMKDGTDAQVEAMLNHMDYFGMGFSWGGYESLLIYVHPDRFRTATTWSTNGPYFRIHVGLEDTADLIADLEAGFERFHKAGS